MRKKLLFIGGNGLTHSLAEYTGSSYVFELAQLIPTKPDRNIIKNIRIPLRIPPDGTVEQFVPLWSEVAFPRLYRFVTQTAGWTTRNRSSSRIRDVDNPFMNVCEYLSDTTPSLNWHQDRDAISMTLAGMDDHDTHGWLGIELRVYLWFLFVHYDQVFCQLTRNWTTIDIWPWYDLCKLLHQKYKCDWASYNYDCVLEATLARIKNNVWTIPSKPPSTFCGIVLHKIHGSIAWTGFPLSTPYMWLWSKKCHNDELQMEYHARVPSSYASDSVSSRLNSSRSHCKIFNQSRI